MCQLASLRSWLDNSSLPEVCISSDLVVSSFVCYNHVSFGLLVQFFLQEQNKYSCGVHFAWFDFSYEIYDVS